MGIFVMGGDDDIKKFAEAYKITFPVGRDNGLAKDLGVRGIPVTVFINKKGRIVKKHIGIIDYRELSSNIGKLLK